MLHVVWLVVARGERRETIVAVAPMNMNLSSPGNLNELSSAQKRGLLGGSFTPAFLDDLGFPFNPGSQLSPSMPKA
jgi:hypothetical protein